MGQLWQVEDQHRARGLHGIWVRSRVCWGYKAAASSSGARDATIPKLVKGHRERVGWRCREAKRYQRHSSATDKTD
jgi:hypothetical protein